MQQNTSNAPLPSPHPPRWLIASFLAVVLGGLTLIVTINAGIFDPIPRHLPAIPLPQTTLTLSNTDLWLHWLDLPLPADELRLTATWQEGSPDSGYGLALGSPDRYLIVAVAATGYTSIWLYEQNDDSTTILLPWQTWPHIHFGSQPNEIDIRRQGTQLSVRINRELLWTGSLPALPPGAALYAQSFQPPSTIIFNHLAGQIGKE